jgi:transposase
MAVAYSTEFREAQVRRLTAPSPATTREVAEETGVHQTTLSRWVREAGGRRRLTGMAKHKTKNHTRATGTEATTPRRPQDWSPEEKLQVLVETAALSDEELGAYLRRKGLHEAQLTQWREAVVQALHRAVPQPKVTAEQKAQKRRIQQLERELNRKEKALAEAAALLVLKKKVQAIWGDGDDGTSEGSD